MIKLVVSDIDGTLLPDGTDRINAELYDIIRELKKKDIIFVAASGRQYASMRYVFEPVADDIIFISENGSIVICRGYTMFRSLLDRALAEELVQSLRRREGGHVMLSTPEAICIESEEPGFVSLLRDSYHNHIRIVEDLIPLCGETNKISLYYTGGGIDRISDEIRAQFEGRLNVAVAGNIWVDCMNSSVDKGGALRSIQETMKIGTEETMAFGDNCNDIGMLARAQESYAVQNAHPKLKEAARYIAPSYEEDGVLRVLRRRLLCGDAQLVERTE